MQRYFNKNMNDKKTLITKDGRDSLVIELESLRTERPVALDHLKKSRELGDLSENGYYKASRFKLNDIDRRIREINRILKTVEVKSGATAGSVEFGSTVELESEGKKYTYQLVSKYESNPSEGKISVESPLGKLLISKGVNDTVKLITPSGSSVYKILKVSV